MEIALHLSLEFVHAVPVELESRLSRWSHGYFHEDAWSYACDKGQSTRRKIFAQACNDASPTFVSRERSAQYHVQNRLLNTVTVPCSASNNVAPGSQNAWDMALIEAGTNVTVCDGLLLEPCVCTLALYYTSLHVSFLVRFL